LVINSVVALKLWSVPEAVEIQLVGVAVLVEELAVAELEVPHPAISIVRNNITARASVSTAPLSLRLGI